MKKRQNERKKELDESVIRMCQNRHNWLGSYYELGLYFASETLNETAKLDFLERVWQNGELSGVVESPDKFGQSWRSVDVVMKQSQYYQCYGCINLGNGRSIGCGSTLIEALDGVFFVLYIPLQMISLVYSVNYDAAITHQGNPWTIKVSELLARIGMDVYVDIPFHLGVIGEEASARPLKRQMTDLVKKTSNLLVPEKKFIHMNISPYGLRSSEGLWWTGLSQEG